MGCELKLGDCQTILKTLKPNSFDAMVTDPPAAIAFMGKDWDTNKGGRDKWIKWFSGVMRDCIRVLKPGAHAFVWAIPKTSHWTTIALEDAGFQIRDIVTHVFGSGFPKSRNLGNGWGTALKPACEHWILVRVPMSHANIAKNVLRWETGGINIDASRIGLPKNDPQVKLRAGKTIHAVGKNDIYSSGVGKKEGDYFNPEGRFPANFVMSHHDECDKICHPECPVKMLDEQSGDIRSRHGYKKRGYTGGGTGNVYTTGKAPIKRGIKVSDPIQNGYLGGASRFFYCAKPSKSERDKGLETLREKSAGERTGRKDGSAGITAYAGATGSARNHHPTVKSIKLMQYLIKMITPPGGMILDPFMGSGSTGIAAKKAGFEFMGIEREKDYFGIAEARIKAVGYLSKVPA